MKVRKPTRKPKPRRKTKPFKTFYVEVPVFKTGVRVIISSDTKRVERAITKWYGEGYEIEQEGVDARYSWLEDSVLSPTIWLKHSPDNPVDVSYLVHEISHFVFRCLKEQRNIHDNETIAYFTEYVLLKVLEKALK